MPRFSPEELEEMKPRLAQARRFDTFPWVEGPPLNQRRVAIVATSGVHMTDDRPFLFNVGDTYRVIPGNVKANDLVISHGEASFDRTGFQRDGNIIFPIDRLHEMVAEGIIGSVADFHYSFGAPMDSEALGNRAGHELGHLLKKDRVTAALVCAPV